MIKLIMVKEILQIGNPVLEKKTTDIADFKSNELKQLVNNLVDTADANKIITAGLAAPQIGSLLSVCVCRRIDLETDENITVGKHDLWEVMINPKITHLSDKKSNYWEGCLSIGIGGDSLFGPVERPNYVIITYNNLKGEVKHLIGRDFLAHEIQHEMDHLKGILFIKYIQDPKNIWRRNALDKYYDEYGDYPPII